MSNVAFRATKFLDFFIPPASKDVANAEADRRLHGRRGGTRSGSNVLEFALWDYCDLRSSLKDAQRPASWSQLVQLRMRRWGDLLDSNKDKRFTIEKDKCVMLRHAADVAITASESAEDVA